MKGKEEMFCHCILQIVMGGKWAWQIHCIGYFLSISPHVLGSGGGGGESTKLFSGRGVQPRFPKCGACDLIIASEMEVS